MLKWTPALLLFVGCLQGDNVVPPQGEHDPDPPDQIEVVTCTPRISISDGDIISNPVKIDVTDGRFGKLVNVTDNIVATTRLQQFDTKFKIDDELAAGAYELEVLPLCGVETRTLTFFVD